MPVRKTLSICIPTFNRAKYLDRLLASISNASSELDGRFEVCISDNCSDDDTPSVVKRWKRNLPITYSRNSGNIGFDANMVKVTKLARGDYIWFFGDDDVLADNALRGLVENLEVAKQKSISAIYINCGSRNSKRGGNFDFSEMRIFHLKEFQKYQLNVFFMDTVCVSRRLARKIVDSTIIRPPLVLKKKNNPVYLFDFMHTYIFLEALSAGTKFGIDPCCRVIPMHDGSDIDFDIIMHHFLNHVLWQVHIQSDYPWFKQKFRLDTLGGKFVRAIAVIRNPELEEKYCICRDVSLLISKMDHNTGQNLQIRLFDIARRNVVGKYILSASFFITMRVFKWVKIGAPLSKDSKMRISIDLIEKLAKKILAKDNLPLTEKQLERFEW